MIWATLGPAILVHQMQCALSQSTSTTHGGCGQIRLSLYSKPWNQLVKNKEKLKGTQTELGVHKDSDAYWPVHQFSITSITLFPNLHCSFNHQ